MREKGDIVIALMPRLLTKMQAAAYAGMTRAGYDRQRRAGKFPDYVPGTWRIDKVALDAAIDAMAKTASPEPTEDPFDKWRRENAARKAEHAAMLAGVEMVTSSNRNGKVVKTYYHRRSGKKLPYNPTMLAFKIAFDRCEEDANKAESDH